MKILRRLSAILLLTSIALVSASGQYSSLLAGRIDRSFGENGVVLGSPVHFAGDSISLDEGTIFWVNTREHNRFQVQVTKLHQNGTPDEQFGSDGQAVFDLGFDAAGLSIARQTDGKILVVGSAEPTNEWSKHDFLIMRLLPNGVLDDGFGTGGIVVRDFPSPNLKESTSDRASSIQLLPDGKILVFGTSVRWQIGIRDTAYLTAVRLNSDGSSDSTFGEFGKIHLAIGTDNSYSFIAKRTAVSASQPDGKLLVGVTVDRDIPGGGFSHQAKLVRFNENGSIDEGFADNGVLVLLPGETTSCNDIIPLENGRILVSFGWGIMRIMPEGSLDTSFGNGGLTNPGFSGFTGDMAITNNGKIFLAGQKNVSAFGGTLWGVVQRYHSNGMPDLRFGTSGTSLLSLGEPRLGLLRLHPVGDRHLYATGMYDLPGGRMMLARFHLGK